jgi:hypothetical protein
VTSSIGVRETLSQCQIIAFLQEIDEQEQKQDRASIPEPKAVHSHYSVSLGKGWNLDFSAPHHTYQTKVVKQSEQALQIFKRPERCARMAPKTIPPS